MVWLNDLVKNVSNFRVAIRNKKVSFNSKQRPDNYKECLGPDNETVDMRGHVGSLQKIYHHDPHIITSETIWSWTGL